MTQEETLITLLVAFGVIGVVWMFGRRNRNLGSSVVDKDAFDNDESYEDESSENSMPDYGADGKVCPLCGSEDTRSIVYGLFRFETDEARRHFTETSIAGGCAVDDNSPKFYCTSCNKRFGRVVRRP